MASSFPPPVPPPGPPPPPAKLRPGPSPWILAAVLMLGGIVGLVVGIVMIDGTSGRFGRVPVPGSVVGDPQPGTYVVADGEYKARDHVAPKIVVLDPTGNELPVERTDPIVGGEDNAIARFVVVAPGPHTVIAEPGADRPASMARSVVVARYTKEVGAAARGGIALMLVAFLAGVVGTVMLIVTIVRSVRARARPTSPPYPPYPAGPAGWPPPPAPR